MARPEAKPKAKPRPIPLEPLTPAAFAPYGTVIYNPQRGGPGSTAAVSVPTGAPANQGSATKYSPISPLTSTYPDASRAAPVISLFACIPRPVSAQHTIDVPVLEQHPFTTQSFVPMGVGAGTAHRAYVVVVAPVGGSTPDPARARAFLAHGAQAVTYAPGTWHAPMIVLGRDHDVVDFVVLQYANGVAADDCVECVLANAGLAGLAVDVTGWERGLLVGPGRAGRLGQGG